MANLSKHGYGYDNAVHNNMTSEERVAAIFLTREKI